MGWALPNEAVVTWRVRGRSSGGVGPWSTAHSFTTTGEALSVTLPGLERFLTIANAAGPLNPPVMGAFAFLNGFPTLDGQDPVCSDESSPLLCNDRPTTNQQVGGARWGINAGGGDGTFTSYMSRSVFGRGGNTQGENLGPSDYEWRFTGQSTALRPFDGTGPATMTVPFELWNIGVGTPNDTSDDFRMIPFVCETACGAGAVEGVFDIGGDHPVSGGANDPLTDWVYWYNPKDTTPGTAGYDKWVAAGANGNSELGGEVLARQVLVGFNLGTAPPYAPALPEEGTIFRIVTTKITLSPPVLSAPADAAALPTTAVALYWQEPVETPLYRIVELARDASFDTLVRSDSVVTAGTHAAWGLEAGQTYYWRVRFAYAGNRLSPWSAAASFTVSATATGVETPGELPQVITLANVWPNPAQHTATVRYGLPEASPVRLVLYDVLGREVLRVRDGDEAAGWHETSLDTGGLASGLYLLRLESAGAQVTRSVVVVR